MASSSFLDKNLGALSKVDPALFKRVCLPVDASHVVENQQRRSLKVHHALVPLELSPQMASPTLPVTDELFVFGLGLGEMVEQLLKTHRQLKLTVWERDAWMLRLALSRNDFARALAQGRLRLLMGVDLLSHLPLALPQVHHPALAPAYSMERALLSSPGNRPRALLCTGALFVEDLADALRDEGHDVVPFELHKLSPEELQYTLQVARPERACSINYTPGLAEFLAPSKVKLWVWEIDPATDVLQKVEAPTSHVRVFTYRKANVEAFRKVGFERVEYLPLATNPRRRTPVSLPDAERAAYASEVSFVGSSMVAQASAYRKQFCSLYAAWKKSPAAAAEADALLSEGLVLQRKDFSRFALKDFLEQYLGGFLGAAHALDPLMLAGEVAASEKRLLYLKALAGASVDVWGDAGWQQASAPHLRYRGQAGHFVELNKIYSHSKINLDIGRIYQPDIVTMRVFDVLACGGFLLAEHSEALGELFSVGEEIESYSTREELSSKVSFYLAHPEKARALAERGRKAVLERHTIAGRLRHMLGS